MIRQTTEPTGPRFRTLPQVAEELATSDAQIMALIKRGDLAALQIGGRGQWRVEPARLEEYTARCYEETDRRLRAGEADPAAALGETGNERPKGRGPEHPGQAPSKVDERSRPRPGDLEQTGSFGPTAVQSGASCEPPSDRRGSVCDQDA